jgi:hypothetical protein
MAQVGRKKGSPKTGGRKAGTPNKIPGALRDDILKAAELAGVELANTAQEKKEGALTYLKIQAVQRPQAFMSLLGRILPTQVEGTGEDGDINITLKFK